LKKEVERSEEDMTSGLKSHQIQSLSLNHEGRLWRSFYDIVSSLCLMSGDGLGISVVPKAASPTDQ
jgi:hypothetical protein